MNKSEVVEGIGTVAGLTPAAAARALDALIEAVTDSLKAGDQVSLDSFGTFKVRLRPERVMRSPLTGEMRTIDAANLAVFLADSALKDAVR